MGRLIYKGSEKTQLTSKIWELNDLSPEEKSKNFSYHTSEELEAPAVWLVAKASLAKKLFSLRRILFSK